MVPVRYQLCKTQKENIVEKETEFYLEGGAYELEVAPASGKEIVLTNWWVMTG